LEEARKSSNCQQSKATMSLITTPLYDIYSINNSFYIDLLLLIIQLL